MAMVSQGDHSAFETVLSEYLDALYAYALRLSGSPAMAEDLVQDTWLAVWQKAASYRARKASLATWLHRILHNQFVDRMRKRRELPEEAGPPASELTDPETTPAQAAKLARDADALREALTTLPENQRAALLLRHASGFSTPEVGAILGVSTRAAESLLARGRRSLKSLLENDAVE